MLLLLLFVLYGVHTYQYVVVVVVFKISLQNMFLQHYFENKLVLWASKEVSYKTYCTLATAD